MNDLERRRPRSRRPHRRTDDDDFGPIITVGTDTSPRSQRRGSRPAGNNSNRGRRMSTHRRPTRRDSGKRAQPQFDPSQFINKNPVDIAPEVYTPTHTFKDFRLHPDIVAAVENQGIESPSPIQDQIIPHIVDGKDVIGLAATGTGKTAAFLLPLIQKMLGRKSATVLIMTPTRELALQVEGEFKKFGAAFRMYATTCVGGTSIVPQLRALRRHQHFIIGTPGRIIDLMDRGAIKPETINTVVLDEADRMLDMGFIHDMRNILGRLPTEGRHTLFFSATMTKEAERIVEDFLVDPVTVSVKKKDVTDSIKQDVVRYDPHHKFDTLLMLLGKSQLKRVIIFGAMKHSVERLAKELCRNSIKAESIHGNKTHGQRQRSLAAFKSGNARVLVATDVAARGIHVDGVTHVINYDLPNTFEDYVHRIGRTGRGTEQGEALTFVPADS
jgi:ATP-dependent RNA helicase RhlE